MTKPFLTVLQPCMGRACTEAAAPTTPGPPRSCLCPMALPSWDPRSHGQGQMGLLRDPNGAGPFPPQGSRLEQPGSMGTLSSYPRWWRCFSSAQVLAQQYPLPAPGVVSMEGGGGRHWLGTRAQSRKVSPESRDSQVR